MGLDIKKKSKTTPVNQLEEWERPIIGSELEAAVGIP